MTSIRVPVSDFIEGGLPEVCVRSGLLAKNRYALVARGADDNAVSGSIPLHTSVVKRIGMLRGVAAFGIVGTLINMAALFVLQSPGFAVGLAAMVAVAISAVVAAGRSGVKARLVENGFVELDPASDGFRLAVMLPPSKCGDGCGCGSSHQEACADDTVASS